MMFSRDERGMTLLSTLVAVVVMVILLALIFPLTRVMKQQVDEMEVRQRMVLAAARIQEMRVQNHEYPLALEEVDPWFKGSGLNWRYYIGSVAPGAPKGTKLRWQYFLDTVDWEQTPIMLCTSLFHPDDVLQISPEGYPTFKRGVNPRFLGVTLSGRLGYFPMADALNAKAIQFLRGEFPNDPPVESDDERKEMINVQKMEDSS